MEYKKNGLTVSLGGAAVNTARDSRFHKESRLDGKAMGKLLLSGIDK
ncbi:hypothetical protein [Dialister invisus]|nr:hypothetical protein [Dialister invisus]